MDLIELFMLFGIPSAITGLGIWWAKRRIEVNERKAQEHEENLEALILMMMQTTRANTVGIKAIAQAVQRIPDAHCNGDMSKALEEMEKIQQEEKQFVMDKGIKYIFE